MFMIILLSHVDHKLIGEPINFFEKGDNTKTEVESKSSIFYFKADDQDVLCDCANQIFSLEICLEFCRPGIALPKF